MRKKSLSRIASTPFDVNLLALPGEDILLKNSSFDTIVMTYSLCTIPDWNTALLQMKRVLKPGGKLLFAEHGLAPEINISKWQNRLNPVWRRFSGSCNLNRPIISMIQEAGFKTTEVETGYLPSVNMVAGFHYRGIAEIPR